MLQTIDHVGYLVRDVDRAAENMSRLFGLSVLRRVEVPQFVLVAAFLGVDQPSVELLTLTEREIVDERLAGRDVMLDHVAYLVSDLDGHVAELRREGVRFVGPNRRDELPGPVELGGARHIWTLPETAGGYGIQLIER